jgi:hypothetical protein
MTTSSSECPARADSPEEGTAMRLDRVRAFEIYRRLDRPSEGLRRNLVAALAPATATTTPAPAAAPPAAATAASATTVTATATSIPAAASTISTPTAARTFFTGACFIHGQWTSFKRLAVELVDGVLCICFACHGDESESARFAGEFILHQHHFADGSGLCEEILEIGLGRVEREVPDVEFCAH